MRISLLVLTAIAVATPAAARRLDTPLQQALAEQEAGRPKTAIALLERMALNRPSDANIRRLLGGAYASAGRYGDARRILAEAQRLAPQDNDIRLARARVELWSDNRGRARSLLQEVAEREPDNRELAEVKAAVERAEGPVRGPGLALAQTIAPVRFADGSRRTWSTTTLSGDIGLDARTRLSADIEHEDRGLAHDTRLAARLDRRMAYGSAYLAGAVTPHADFREQWSIQGGGEVQLTSQVMATLDVRHADYGTTTSNAVTPGVRFAPADHKTSLWLRSINLWNAGEHQNGWSARLDHTPSDALQLFAGAATYPDTEAGVTRRVKSVYAGGAVALSKNLTLRLTADREHRAQSYRRTGFTVGVGWRFGR